MLRKIVQFSCFSAFVEANVELEKKKRKIHIYMIVNLPKIVQRQTTSFLSPLLLSLTSIHSVVFLRWLSLSHALVMEDFAVSLWKRCAQSKFSMDSLTSLSHLTVLMMLVWYIRYLYQKQSLPPILPALHFISVSGAAEEKVKMEMLGGHTLRLGWRIKMETKILRKSRLHQLQYADTVSRLNYS